MLGWGYPSLKIVLEHLEAYKRIDLVRRCPELENIDKATPLTRKFLYLGKTALNINGSVFHVGVIRQFPKNTRKIPKEFKREIEVGGSDFDLDQFGRALWTSGDNVILPGDVPIQSVSAPHIERTDAEEDQYMEAVKARQAHLKTLRKMKERQEEMGRIESLLYTWEFRKQGILPPYTKYLQYTREGKDGTKSFEYLECRKLHEAMKYLYNSLFEGRIHPIAVRNLKIGSVGGVLRLPENLKIKAREIYLGSNITSIMVSISSILVENSTFDSVGVFAGTSLANNYEHPLVKSARCFVIVRTKITGDNFHIVMNSENPRIDVQHGKCTKEEYISVIDKLIREKKPVGTLYSFGVHCRNTVKEVFEAVKDRPGMVSGPRQERRGCPRFPVVYSCPVTESSKLFIWCNRDKDYDDKKRNYEPWILWFSIDKDPKEASVDERKPT